MTYRIAIPSRNRADKQKTLYNLPESVWPNVSIFVPDFNVDEYKQKLPSEVKIVSVSENGIRATRQAMFDSVENGKILMLDDDLTFWKRNKEGNKFKRIDKEETGGLIEAIVCLLDIFTAVGLTDKFMSQTKRRNFQEFQRFNDVLCYNKDLMTINPIFRTETDEDHDFHLQLLVSGHRTAVCTEYTKTNTANAKGGCSDWRNDEVQKKVFQDLLNYWPGIVSLIPKPNYVSQFRTRYNWKKAAKQGGLI